MARQRGSILRWLAVTLVAGTMVAGTMVAGTGLGTASAATPTIKLNPNSGPPGQVVQVTGKNFQANETIEILYLQGTNGNIQSKLVGTTTADSTGGFVTNVTIPAGAALGHQHIRAQGTTSHLAARNGFDVT